MARPGQNVVSRAVLDHFAIPHHRTRSAISLTTPKSWVMNSTPEFRRLWIPWISFKIWAWVVTSNAVVGLIGDQQRRLQRDRHGDDHTLPLTAG